MNYFQKMAKLVMFKHTIFSLPFIFISMVVASDGWFGWKLLFLGLIEAISARNFAMGVNRYLDRDIDILNERTKNRPNVDGSVSTAEMQIFIIANALIFIGVAGLVNDLTLKLSIPILIVLGVYSYFKRFSSSAHLILGVALGLAPIAGAIAVLDFIPSWSVFLSIGVMFWVAGFDILYSIQDKEFDAKNGLYSIPSIYGINTSLALAQLFHLFTIIFWALFMAYSGVGFLGWIALGIIGFILYKEHEMVNKDFLNIPKAFFELNSYIGIIYLIMIILDKA